MRGVLVLRPGDSIRHVVDFQEVKIAVPVLVPTMKGMIIKTSGGASARVGGANPDTMYLGDGHGESGLIVPNSQRRGVQPFRFAVEQNRLGFAYGMEIIRASWEEPSPISMPVKWNCSVVRWVFNTACWFLEARPIRSGRHSCHHRHPNGKLGVRGI